MTSFKTRQSYNLSNHAHFLTFSCYKRLPLLNSDKSRRWLIDSLQALRKAQSVSLLAYVIMPEHVHLLVYPRSESYQMSRILAGIKRPVSRVAREWYAEHDPRMIESLRVVQGDRIDFRFWQAGGGYDQNITDSEAIWQIAEYIHANPVRRGLVEDACDWQWSSARFWSGLGGVEIEMDRVGR